MSKSKRKPEEEVPAENDTKSLLEKITKQNDTMLLKLEKVLHNKSAAEDQLKQQVSTLDDFFRLFGLGKTWKEANNFCSVKSSIETNEDGSFEFLDFI